MIPIHSCVVREKFECPEKYIFHGVCRVVNDKYDDET